MFPNLDLEMRKKGLKRKDLAILFGDRVPTVSERLNGKSELTMREAISIQKKFFPDLEIDYLFKMWE